ncbi:MAG: ABC transporter ATP-binding protein [Solirubrobacterales bacterium]
MKAITVRDLRKRYGQLEALRGISFDIEEGEVFGLLGPNGAGKTTTVEICEGFRDRTAGQVLVLGHDPARRERSLRARVGIVLQSTGVEAYLTVAETIELYRRLYPAPRPLDEIIELVGLTGQRDARVGKLSGGQTRRLDVAVALAGDPELLFLDEPTTGFDPAARRGAWEVIKNLAALGKTIFLTTHYMEEAQELADRVAIIADGRIVAEGAPDDLGDRDNAPATISFRLPQGSSADELPGEAAGASTVNGSVRFSSGQPVQALNELTGWALARGVELEGLEVRRPSLEDVYLDLTGQQ